MMHTRLTVTDLGLLAVALDDAQRDGIGDDETVDRLAAVLVGNGWDEAEAATLAAAYISELRATLEARDKRAGNHDG